jgi:hypothetical protein
MPPTASLPGLPDDYESKVSSSNSSNKKLQS